MHLCAICSIRLLQMRLVWGVVHCEGGSLQLPNQPNEVVIRVAWASLVQRLTGALFDSASVVGSCSHPGRALHAKKLVVAQDPWAGYPGCPMTQHTTMEAERRARDVGEATESKRYAGLSPGMHCKGRRPEAGGRERCSSRFERAQGGNCSQKFPLEGRSWVAHGTEFTLPMHPWLYHIIMGLTHRQRSE